MQQSKPYMVLAVALLAVAARSVQALETRGNPQSNGRGSRLQKNPAKASDGTTCGTSDDLAKRVEVCAKPLMDLVQGTVEKWPRNEEDAMALCESFGVSEKCIKDSARKCGKGIQKTIVSTVGSSVARGRKRECARSRAAGIVKTTSCVERHHDVVEDWMRNVTSRLSAIELQTREGEKKVNAVCCMVGDIENEIKNIFKPLCPTEGQLVVRLYRAIVEDVVGVVCRNPKCNNYLRPYKITRVENIDGIISIILRIVFSLDEGI